MTIAFLSLTVDDELTPEPILLFTVQYLCLKPCLRVNLCTSQSLLQYIKLLQNSFFPGLIRKFYRFSSHAGAKILRSNFKHCKALASCENDPSITRYNDVLGLMEESSVVRLPNRNWAQRSCWKSRRFIYYQSRIKCPLFFEKLKWSDDKSITPHGPTPY